MGSSTVTSLVPVNNPISPVAEVPDMGDQRLAEGGRAASVTAASAAPVSAGPLDSSAPTAAGRPGAAASAPAATMAAELVFRKARRVNSLMGASGQGTAFSVL